LALSALHTALLLPNLIEFSALTTLKVDEDTNSPLDRRRPSDQHHQWLRALVSLGACDAPHAFIVGAAWIWLTLRVKVPL
jgi:hypothetical protein